jgi:hypothetical protein
VKKKIGEGRKADKPEDVWKERYDRLLKLGVTPKEAHRLMRGRWEDVDEFSLFLERLREIRMGRNRLEHILQNAHARQYIEDSIGITCKRLKGAKKAIEYYLIHDTNSRLTTA